MNRGLPSPAARLFRGETRVVMPSLINEIYGTVGATGPRKRRNSIYKETKA